MLIRVPSKAIQYGYIEREIPDTGTPEGDAEAYLTYVGSFQIAEIDFIKAKQESVKAPLPEPVDVATPTSSNEEPDSIEDSDEDSEDVDEASKTLAEGLGGVTQVPDEEAPWEKAAPQAPASNPWDDGPVFDWS